MVYLQQDAFDDVDAFCSIERQKETFLYVVGIIKNEFQFVDKKDVRDLF